MPDIGRPGLAAVHDELTLWSARFGLLLLDALELRPETAGLDLGCGTGFPLLELAEIHGSGSHFTGVDTWEAALTEAEKKRNSRGLENVRLLLADAASMPLPDSSFDLVVSNLGLNNFAGPDRVLDEVRRVALPGARLVLTTNPTGTMGEFYETFGSVLAQAAPDRLRALEAQEAHRGSESSLKKLLERHGFRIERVLRDRFRLRFLNGGAMLRHHLCGWFLSGWREVVAGLDERGIFEELERALDAAAETTGELRMTVPMLYVEAVKQ